MLNNKIIKYLHEYVHTKKLINYNLGVQYELNNFKV